MDDACAVVFGASGGIGAALVEAIESSGHYRDVVSFARNGEFRFDLEDEASIAAAAVYLASLLAPTLIVDATGMLHADGVRPEKSLKSIDPAAMAKAFAINATGPALLMKHMLPLLPRDRRSVFATLSAKVGSIGDNRLGGWYAYRASKAALNQLVRTAAIELKRANPSAICVAIHPGTVATGLSSPFAKSGLEVQTPDEAARAILAFLNGLQASDTGGFFDRKGGALPW